MPHTLNNHKDLAVGKHEIKRATASELKALTVNFQLILPRTIVQMKNKTWRGVLGDPYWMLERYNM